MSRKVFIDSDIIIDVLAKRETFYEPATRLLELGYARELELYTTAVIMANVFYVIRKKYWAEESKKLLKKLRLAINILPMGETAVDSALNSQFSDFEDALQYFAALENEISVIITRNKKDYKEHNIKIQTAEEYLAEL
ncbi:PIN domain-containing protein [Deferribacterales bacterium RsTz2092]